MRARVGVSATNTGGNATATADRGGTASATAGSSGALLTWRVLFSFHLASLSLLGATATSRDDDRADPLGDEIMALLVDGQRQRRREGSALSEIMGEVARAQAAAAATDRAEAEAKLAALQGGVIVFASFCVFVFGGLVLCFFSCALLLALVVAVVVPFK